MFDEKSFEEMLETLDKSQNKQIDVIHLNTPNDLLIKKSKQNLNTAISSIFDTNKKFMSEKNFKQKIKQKFEILKEDKYLNYDKNFNQENINSNMDVPQVYQLIHNKLIRDKNELKIKDQMDIQNDQKSSSQYLDDLYNKTQQQSNSKFNQDQNNLIFNSSQLIHQNQNDNFIQINQLQPLDDQKENNQSVKIVSEQIKINPTEIAHKIPTFSQEFKLSKKQFQKNIKNLIKQSCLLQNLSEINQDFGPLNEKILKLTEEFKLFNQDQQIPQQNIFQIIKSSQQQSYILLNQNDQNMLKYMFQVFEKLSTQIDEQSKIKNEFIQNFYN